MRGKDFNAGLRGVLFEAQHYERMGSALWLYGWLILRQTRQEGTTGWVLGGKPIGYREIEEETGFEPRTLERWMRILREGGYVQTRTAAGGVIVQITKAKKFSREAGVRNIAERVRRNAERSTQNCGDDAAQETEMPAFPGRISSGYVEGKYKNNGFCLGKAKPRNPERALEPSTQSTQFPQNRQALLQLRNLKQEIVRCELRAGEGPCVRRSGTGESESA
ncbi:MAG: hypothetical protein WAK91_03005 [Candidatus Acidiferrales bacterium]|jgi:hypothetical protein